MGIFDYFRPYKHTLENIQDDLNKKLFGDISKNILLAERMRDNSIILQYVRSTDSPIDLRMEALVHLVDINAPYLKPRTDENARTLLEIWGKLLTLWTVHSWPYLSWRRRQPYYDPALPRVESVEEKVSALCESHLIWRGVFLVWISYGDQEITSQYTNIMMKNLPPVMGVGAGMDQDYLKSLAEGGNNSES